MRRGGLLARAIVIGVSRRLKKLGTGWTVRPFDPAIDLAPEFYGSPGRERSCDGAPPELPPALRGATGSASSRGWGPGWPNCQYSKWVTITRRDGQRLTLHREIAELVAMLCDETERLGYDLIPGWSWGAACRAIRGSSSPSNHSWALAVDLNAPENPMGPRTGRIRRFPAVIALWELFGFRSGTKYTGRADDMHMEFMGTPADAKAMTDRARRELGQEEDDMAAIFKDRNDAKAAFREVLDEEPSQRKPKGMRYLTKLVHNFLGYDRGNDKYPFFGSRIDRLERVAAAIAEKVGVELDENGEPVG